MQKHWKEKSSLKVNYITFPNEFLQIPPFFSVIDTLRVYRPRVILHGSQGMGQVYVGAAALHYLEGFHVQSLDLGSLLGDSSRVCPL